MPTSISVLYPRTAIFTTVTTITTTTSALVTNTSVTPTARTNYTVWYIIVSIMLK